MPIPKKPRRPDGPLDAYKRIRKPMPPPERVMPDKRRKVLEREAKQQEREAGEES